MQPHSCHLVAAIQVGAACLLPRINPRARVGGAEGLCVSRAATALVGSAGAFLPHSCSKRLQRLPLEPGFCGASGEGSAVPPLQGDSATALGGDDEHTSPMLPPPSECLFGTPDDCEGCLAGKLVLGICYIWKLNLIHSVETRKMRHSDATLCLVVKCVERACK